MTERVVVVGAGIGGLACAARLAAAGREVCVVEQGERVGGKMGEERAAGFRWDTGPSVVTMRHVFEELYRDVGRRLEDALELRPVEPLTRYFFADGARLDASRDPEVMAREIARIEPRDVEGYRSFLRYAARLHRITGPVFVYDRPPRWSSMLRVPPWDVARVDAWRTLHARVRRHVRSPQLRQLLDRFATYAGSDPYRASATLGVIADVELGGGVWYPRGGVYAIAQALERLVRELGVELRTGCAVERIRVESSSGGARACGVRLAGGEELAAEAVVANLDVAAVYRRLLPPTPAAIEEAERLERLEPSTSGFVLMLGVEGEHPELAHHNLFFSGNYRREFEQLSARRELADDPTTYVAITSKSDPEHAPPGCENWFVLVNTPPLGGRADAAWEDGGERYRDHVLALLARRGLDVRRAVRVERRLTPVDLAARTAARQGALYGASLNGMLAPFRRPHNRARGVRGLYFVGGTTHPGGGVPMVILSSRVVVGLMAEDGLLHEGDLGRAGARPALVGAESTPSSLP